MHQAFLAVEACKNDKLALSFPLNVKTQVALKLGQTKAIPAFRSEGNGIESRLKKGKSCELKAEHLLALRPFGIQSEFKARTKERCLHTSKGVATWNKTCSIGARKSISKNLSFHVLNEGSGEFFGVSS